MSETSNEPAAAGASRFRSWGPWIAGGALVLAGLGVFGWRELHTIRFLSQAAYGPALVWAESLPGDSFHMLYLQDAFGTVELGRFEDRQRRLRMMLVAWAPNSKSLVALTCAGSANLLAYDRQNRRTLPLGASQVEIFRAYLQRDFKVEIPAEDVASRPDSVCSAAEAPFRQKYRIAEGLRMVQLN